MKTTVTFCLLLAVVHTFAQAGSSSNTVHSVAPQSAATDEQRLMAAIPEIRWGEGLFAASGWLKPGQRVSPKANRFSKEGFARFGVNGDVGFLFQEQQLVSFNFDLDDGQVGSSSGNDDWIKLYKAVKTICTSPERRTGDAKFSYTSWTIAGETNSYCVQLVRRVSGATIERGMVIYIGAKGVSQPCPAGN